MSTEQEQARALAERIAARLARAPEERAADDNDADVGRELAALRATLGQIQQRLAHIESHVHTDEHTHGERAGQAPPPRSPNDQTPRASAPSHWTTSTYIPVVEHPSQERFGVGEAVEELVNYFEREKVCNVEPGGKPCDHCAMCSSRGF
jgi:hypothetical protein